MIYEVIFDEAAITFLSKLPEQQRTRIYKKIIDAKKNPFHFFEILKGRKEYKLRVGDYRVIADIQKRRKTINILHIGHRRNIYKRA